MDWLNVTVMSEQCCHECCQVTRVKGEGSRLCLRLRNVMRVTEYL